MKYYIKDTTLNGNPVKIFDLTDHVLMYLKEIIQRKTVMTPSQYLTHLADLGHFGYDDRELYESLLNSIDMGVLRGKNLLRCNIFEANIKMDGSD